MALSAEKREAFAQQNFGEELQVVVEQPLKDDEGFWVGTSGNYLRVRFATSEDQQGKIVRVRVTDADPHFVNGVVVDD